MKTGYIISIVLVMGASFGLQYNALRNDAEEHSKIQPNPTTAYDPSNKQTKIIQLNSQNTHPTFNSTTPVITEMTNDKIELVGCIETSPGKGFAFIKLNSGEAYKYNVGEIIINNVVLKEVHRDKATFQDKENVFELTIERQVATNGEDSQVDTPSEDQKLSGVIPERSFSKLPVEEETSAQDQDENKGFIAVMMLEEGQSRSFGSIPPDEPDYSMTDNDDGATVSLMEQSDPGMSRTFATKPAPEAESASDQDVVIDSEQPAIFEVPVDKSY